MMRPEARSLQPARRHILTGGLLLGLSAGLSPLLGAIVGREARAQSKPTVTVHKSPT